MGKYNAKDEYSDKVFLYNVFSVCVLRKDQGISITFFTLFAKFAFSERVYPFLHLHKSSMSCRILVSMTFYKIYLRTKVLHGCCKLVFNILRLYINLTLFIIEFPFHREFSSEKILEKRPPTMTSTSIGVIINKREF